MGDKLGRRLTILVGALVFCLGGALQTGAQALSYLYAGRLIAGLGVGILVMIIPVYQGELAHPDIRGRITALVQFMLGIGALAAAWISYGMLPLYCVRTNTQTDLRQARISDSTPPTTASGAHPLESKLSLPFSSPRSFCSSPNRRAGSSITDASRKVSVTSPSCTPTEMSRTRGFKLNSSRSRTNSASSTNTKQSRMLSSSRTSHVSAASSSHALCKHQCR